MKILKVVINNIHSIKGKYTIDFVNGILGDAGLYAITGQTGAGKSTILDAITLALYGMTNRHGKGNSDAEIITRNEKESFSETYFEINDCEYMARWSVSVNRNNNLNKAERKICKVINGEIGEVLGDQKKNTQSVINDIVGLTFEQFTKSVLLAQNNFSAFLKADANERAEMLSKITGTQIYEEVSKAVYEKFKVVESELQMLKSQLKNDLLSEEELTILNESIIANELLIQENKKLLDTFLIKINWLNDIETNTKELQKQEQNLTKLNQQLLGNAGLFEKLSIYNKAKSIEFDLVNFDEKSKKVTENSEALTLLSKSIQDKSEALELARKSLQVIEIEFGNVNVELDEKLPKIKKASGFLIEKRQKELQVVEFKSTLEQLETSLSSANDVFAKTKSFIGNIENEISQKESELKTVSVFSNWETERPLYGEKYSQIKRLQIEIDALESVNKSIEIEKIKIQNLQLENELIGFIDEENLIFNQLENIQAKRKTFLPISELNVQKAEIQAKINSCNKLKLDFEKYESVIPQVNSFTEKNKQDIHSLNQLNNDLMNEKEKLALLNQNKFLQSKIASLEEHRKHLVDGEECPLCGSIEHPFVTLNFDKSSNDVDVKIKESEIRINEILVNKSSLEKQISSTEIEIKHLENQQKELQVNIVNIKAEIGFEEFLTIEQIEKYLFQNNQLQIDLEHSITELTILNEEYERLNEKYSALKTLNEQRKLDKLELVNKLALLEQTIANESKLKLEKQASIDDCFEEIDKILVQYKLTLPSKTIKEIEILGKSVSEQFGKWKLAFEFIESNKLLFVQHQNELEKSQIQMANTSKEITNIKAKLGVLENDLQELTKQIHILTKGFQLEIPEQEEVRIRTILEAFSSKMKTINAEISGNEVYIQENLKKEKQLKLEIEADKVAVLNLANSLNVFLAENNFQNIQSIREILKFEEIDPIQVLKAELEQAKQQALGAQNSISEKLHSLKNQNITSENVEELSRIKNELEFNQNELVQLVGGDKEKLRRNKAEEESNLETKHKIENQNLVYQKWQQLNDLIGSADGKKFKKFAQDFTLSLLVQHANKHLKVMFNRYELVKTDDSAEMELQIKDKNFFDALRNINSLSGGETFLVSLSLALGLSDLASKNTKIRSLFIDEGFGTLDPENLNNALDALELLRQTDDRQIGIISHVEELKKRIHTQIQVNKISAEYSSIQIVE